MSGALKKGDKVTAKWPGSRHYEKATIVEVTESKEGHSYRVQYADSTFSDIKAGDVKPLTEKSSAKATGKSPSSPVKGGKSPSRTPKSRSGSRGRKQERSPSRSPARTKASKSPPKSRGRSRSASRTKTTKPKGPGSKTPPRTPATPQSPKKKSGKPKKSESLFSSPDSSPSPVKKIKSAKLQATPTSPGKRGRPAKKKLQELGEVGDKIEVVPLLGKLSKIQALEKEMEEEEEEEEMDVVKRKVYSTRSKTVATSVKEAEARAAASQGSTSQEVKFKPGIVGVLSSLLASLILPATTIYLALNCVRRNTNIFVLPQLPKVSALFSYKMAGIFLAFVITQALLNALPIGRVVRGFHSQHKSRLLYRLNGLYSLIGSVGLLAVLGYLGQPITIVNDNFFRLTCVAVAFSFVFSVALHIWSLFLPVSQLNQSANTGCTPYDFYHGRALNPRIGSRYDMKMLLIRSALIGWALVDVCLTYKCFLLNGKVHYEMALTVAAQVIYILDLLYREEVLLGTATVEHEGLGFWLSHAAWAVCPFTFSIPVYYLAHHQPNMPLYCLPGMAILFLFALRMNRSALAAKTLIKRNPDSSEFSGVKKIVSGEKALVTSGWWGLVRHPNYISEILMFLAWTLPCGVQTVLPYLPVVLVFLHAVRRCFHVESAMSRNYPETYEQYRHRVPHRLCPYVF